MVSANIGAFVFDGKTLEVAKSLGLGMNIQPAVPTSPSPTYYEDTTDDLRQSSAGSSGIVSLDTAMRHHIEKNLAVTRGKIEGRGGAAEMLKINPHTLRARMRKLGISWSKFRPNELPDVII